MNVLTFSQARAGLKQAMDDACRDHEPVLITRQRGDHVVMLSLSDFNSMAETMYLTSTLANTRHLRESIAQLKAAKVFIKEVSLDVAEEKTTEQD